MTKRDRRPFRRTAPAAPPACTLRSLLRRRLRPALLAGGGGGDTAVVDVGDDVRCRRRDPVLLLHRPSSVMMCGHNAHGASYNHIKANAPLGAFACYNLISAINQWEKRKKIIEIKPHVESFSDSSFIIPPNSKGDILSFASRSRISSFGNS